MSNPTVQDDIQEKHALKIYGSTFETKSSVVARFSGRKRTFSYDPTKPDAKKRARMDAETFLEKMTMEKKHINSYIVIDSIAHIEVACEKDRSIKFIVTVDEQDVDKLKNKVWYVRTNKNKDPCHVYYMHNEFMCQHRVYLPEHLFGTTKITYLDNNILNNVRTNVYGAIKPKIDCVKQTSTIEQHIPASNYSSKSTSSCSKKSTNVSFTSKKPILHEFADCPDSFERFCYSEGPSIPKHEWTACKRAAKKSAQHEKAILKNVAQCLGKHYPTFPFPHYTDVKIRENTDRVLGFKVRVGNGQLGRNYAGQLLCKRYMFEIMFKCGYRRGTKHVTPEKMWTDQKQRVRVLAHLLRGSQMLCVTPETLMAATTFCLYVPSNFRPTAAKTIYELFGGSGRVLDLCSGYGGRLVGYWFAKNTTHYVGFDPNKMLLPAYNNITRWLEKSYPETKKSFRFFQCGSETDEARQVLQNQEPFDLVFTSPPYFDCELYDTSDPTQSYTAHGSSYRSWLTGFLFVALQNGSNSIKPGGYMVINVANGTTFPTLVEDTVTYATQTLGLVHKKTMRYVLSRRPGSRKENYEPVLVFKKKEPIPRTLAPIKQ